MSPALHLKAIAYEVPGRFGVVFAFAISALCFLVIIAVPAFGLACRLYPSACLCRELADPSARALIAATSASARQQSKSIVLTCVLLFRMCEFEWQWFCTDGCANARMTPILTSSSNAFPNFCSYSLHVTLPAFERLSMVRLHRSVSAVTSIASVLAVALVVDPVAFSPRHASRPLLTSVFFTVTKALPSHNSDRAKHSLLDGDSLQSLPSGVLRSI